MQEKIAQELVAVLKASEHSEFDNAFERAFELTKAYAGSANAQPSAIPATFEKLFELFATGKYQQ